MEDIETGEIQPIGHIKLPRFWLGLKCPDCREVTSVADGSAIPLTCCHCHRWWGPGRAPIAFLQELLDC